MPDTLTYTGQLVTTTCWCGIHYAVPRSLLASAHDDGHTIYCPLGHTCTWKKTEADRLREQLEREQARAARMSAVADQANARADHEAARAAGYKGALTRAKKRIGKGVCPACNRHFQNVERHMHTQHPDLADPAAT